MRFLALILMVVAVTLLTGCGSLWMTVYRYKGGYYDRPEKRSENTSSVP